MNDRYLYKAKRIDNGEWVEGALFDGEKYCVIGQQIKFSPYIENECKIVGYMVDPSTICKCTGLKDKNGKLIWESDVVRKVDTNALGYHRERICTVSYEKSGYWNIITTLGDGYWIGEFEKEQLEVIGNKFDNPEMLEVEE